MGQASRAAVHGWPTSEENRVGIREDVFDTVWQVW